MSAKVCQRFLYSIYTLESPIESSVALYSQRKTTHTIQFIRHAKFTNMLECYDMLLLSLHQIRFLPLGLGDSFTPVKCRMQNLDEDRKKQTILCKTHQTKISRLLHSQVVVQVVLRLITLGYYELSMFLQCQKKCESSDLSICVTSSEKDFDKKIWLFEMQSSIMSAIFWVPSMVGIYKCYQMISTFKTDITNVGLVFQFLF